MWWVYILLGFFAGVAVCLLLFGWALRQPTWKDDEIAALQYQLSKKKEGKSNA